MTLLNVEIQIADFAGDAHIVAQTKLSPLSTRHDVNYCSEFLFYLPKINFRNSDASFEKLVMPI